MATSGIMQRIRRRLSSGESAQALITQGYAPGSVYKVQWQLRKAGKLSGKPPAHFRQYGDGDQGAATALPSSTSTAAPPEESADAESVSSSRHEESLELSAMQLAELKSLVHELTGKAATHALDSQLRHLQAQLEQLKQLREQDHQLLRQLAARLGVEPPLPASIARRPWRMSGASPSTG